MSSLRVTYGMIVLNGEPFIKYNLRSLYPFAHEIIVVEGASPHAAASADPSGHSVDATLDTVRSFIEEEDPEKKIILITAEDEGHPNGFWPGEKDEQSQAYASRATGNWLWQVDVDEFYKQSDIRAVLEMLDEDPSITAVTFPEIPFWGSFDYRCEGILLRMSYSRFHRLFQWRKGYRMITHRPPTVMNAEGIDLRSINWVTAQEMERRGVYLYHYSQLFPSQVSKKMAYYDQLIRGTGRRRTIRGVERWYCTTFAVLKNPYRVHTVNTSPSWLLRFAGSHPEQIESLRAAIERREVKISMRDMADVERLLPTRRYRLGIRFWHLWANSITQTKVLCREFLKHRITGRRFLQCLLMIGTGQRRVF